MLKKLTQQFPSLNRTVWILAFGRLLSEIGTGFVLFYASIFFVNQVGLSATLVGVALGSGQVAGVLGRFLGGVFTDSKSWGRRRTLLLSAAVSVLADVVLGLTYNFPTLLLGNLVLGLGVGLYWPATEAVIADITAPDERNEAFAITRVADSLGLGIGVVLGGLIISTAGNYRLLFAADGVSFLVFFAVIYFAVEESYQFFEEGESSQRNPFQGWGIALRDRAFVTFLSINILFTTYISQIQSTLPLYFRNYVHTGGEELGFSPQVISALFTWHITFAAIMQLPMARFLNRFRRAQALTFSFSLWLVGFVLIWVTGITQNAPLLIAVVALGILSLGLNSYTPSASSLVADIAPASLRGVYLSLNSQCWAVGFFIGPPVGGWALDQARVITDQFWLVVAATTLIGMIVLRSLNKLLKS
ncbi:major facilitator superfamily MFS_1 [Halothece sp. PCC 7418]|uniref:MFS transporter n=1 Tax=Halothece sp. (strain PCC 7418) TaxID=65093 RepID=UPI0002A06118|nr:MFS transporter [Halothece sp. PCC 7418]AFZ43076.1 major facilitator superfamily MFS_1 [Halothece sp. PCC 7418]